MNLDYLNKLATRARADSLHWDALAQATKGQAAIYAAKQAVYHRSRYRDAVAKIDRITKAAEGMSKADQIEAMWQGRDQ